MSITWSVVAFLIAVFAVHETGHWIAARLVKAKTAGLAWTPLGPGLRFDDAGSPGKGIFVYLGGTFANLFVAAVILLLDVGLPLERSQIGRVLQLVGIASAAFAVLQVVVGIIARILLHDSAVDIAMVLQNANALATERTGRTGGTAQARRTKTRR